MYWATGYGISGDVRDKAVPLRLVSDVMVLIFLRFGPGAVRSIVVT
jgi:hypothetical protein